MPLVLQSSGGGQVTLQEPATASNFTLTLPTTSGTAITDADTATVTPAMLSQKLTRGTTVATTSGTAIDFTNIPSWVTRITVTLNNVSASSTGTIQVQLGTSSGFTTTGYVSTVVYVQGTGPAVASSTTGFFFEQGSAGFFVTTQLVLTYMGDNNWVGTSSVSAWNNTTARAGSGGGRIALPGTLDRLRLTTTGADTFDSGSINIIYE